MTQAAAKIVRIAGLRRCVANLARSVDFYRGALGFEPVDLGPSDANTVRLQLGSEWIDLIQVDAGSVPEPAFAPDPRFQHAAIVARDMDAAWQRLLTFGPDAITTGGPQRLPIDAGGVSALKFRDPDGHPLELIEFPPGTGDPRWRPSSPSMTLGIDHFAVVVADADRSIAFYAMHGLVTNARHLNRGVEQARLDGLATSIVEVIALHAATQKTPHVELLCYRDPRPSGGPISRLAGARDVIAVTGSRGPPADVRIVDPDGHEMWMSSC